MTTHFYYSMPSRIAALIVLLSCVAIGFIATFFEGSLSDNFIKCMIAMWVFIAGVGVDVLRNHYKSSRCDRKRKDEDTFVLPRIEQLRIKE